MNQASRPDAPSRRFAKVFLVMCAVALGASFLGPDGRAFALAGVATMPFAVLAGLGYVAEERPRVRIGALVMLGAIIVLAALVFAGQAEALLAAYRRAGPLTPETERRALFLPVFFLAAMVLSAACLHPRVRRVAGRVLPLDPERFVHALALSLVVGLIISALAPLIVLGEPVSTAHAAMEEAEPGAGASMAELYHLYWLLPVSMLAVGWRLRRSFSQTLARLGLERPSARQAGKAILLGAGLVIGVVVLSAIITWAWGALGWPSTDHEALERLMGGLLTPTGAVIVGVSAGIGEEIAIRGVLQPRLGIVLSNLLFTSLHAGQYNWDILIIIFSLGIVFGLVRKRGNTTMSAIVHCVYDILVVLLSLAK